MIFRRGATRREIWIFPGPDVYPLLLPESIACPWARHGELPETTDWNVHIPILFPKSIDFCCQLPAAGTFHPDGMCTFHSITKIYCRASKIRAARHIPHSIIMIFFCTIALAPGMFSRSPANVFSGERTNEILARARMPNCTSNSRAVSN